MVNLNLIAVELTYTFSDFDSENTISNSVRLCNYFLLVLTLNVYFCLNTG